MFGKNNQFLENNVAKLLAAKEAGYVVFVVLDDKTISLSTFIRSISHLFQKI